MTRHPAHPPTLEVTTPGDREIVMRREFAAPRQLVFDALTQPGLLVRWYGARGWTLVRCEVDLRVGGSWRFVSRGPDGTEMGQSGVYREIEAPERLIYTETFDDQSFAGESLVTQELTDRHGLTTLTSTVVYPSPEARDYTVSMPMERGLGEAYQRLDQVLAGMADSNTAQTEGERIVNWSLEVVKVPVSDLDRARSFYSEQLGFPVDFEVKISDERQFLQVTPPGSGCSIVLAVGVTAMAPGSLESPQLVVPDIRAARAHLVENGVDAGEVQVAGRDGSFRPATDDETGAALDNVGIVFFSDPDGNRWAVQQISGRG